MHGMQGNFHQIPCNELLAVQGVQGTVRECLFESNVADFGGAIFRGSTSGDIIGSVFTSNKASKIGGAIYDSHAKACVCLDSCSGNSLHAQMPWGNSISTAWREV